MSNPINCIINPVPYLERYEFICVFPEYGSSANEAYHNVPNIEQLVATLIELQIVKLLRTDCWLIIIVIYESSLVTIVISQIDRIIIFATLFCSKNIDKTNKSKVSVIIITKRIVNWVDVAPNLTTFHNWLPDNNYKY